jgi:hypothetical protein
MATTKLNNYSPGQKLNNQASNIDYNRLSNDLSYITVNFGTTPATVTVYIGSLIEVNGNYYTVDASNVSFQMANATDNYLTFTDSPSIAYSSASTKGTYNVQKQGFYQTGDIVRTLRWFIDQTLEDYYVMPDVEFSMGYPLRSDLLSKVSAYLGSNQAGATTNTLVNLDTELYDVLNEFNTSSKLFTASYDGWYQVCFSVYFDPITSDANPNNFRALILKNGSTEVIRGEIAIPTIGNNPNALIVNNSKTIYLDASDTLGLYFLSSRGSGAPLVAGDAFTYLIIDRIF